MSNTTTSPNMNLIVPTVGMDPGPDWANNINADFSILDSHNHSSGMGVAIQPNGMNINADLPFNGNNATLLRSTRYSPQSLPIPNSGSDVGCLYVSGNEIYYNDVSGGNQIQITSNGSVNAGAGSITGLPSGTASASFSAGTFVWQSATATAANMDAGSYIFRNSGASSKSLTLSPPSAMAANIAQTLPTIPASTSFMQMDSSGNMGASIAVAGGITLTNMAANSVGTSQLIDASVTPAKLAALGQQISSSCGSYALTGSFATVTNLSVTITTTGRPVMVSMISDASGTGSNIGGSSGNFFMKILRDAVEIGRFTYAISNSVSFQAGITINQIDIGASAASHTYQVQAALGTASNANIENYKLLVYEL